MNIYDQVTDAPAAEAPALDIQAMLKVAVADALRETYATQVAPQHHAPAAYYHPAPPAYVPAAPACGCHGHHGPQQFAAPAPAPKPVGRTVAMIGAATVGTVAVLGTVTALLLAVAITAVSVAISGLVIYMLVKKIVPGVRGKVDGQ